MGWGVYSEISSGVVWVRSVGVLSCVICWRAVVVFARLGGLLVGFACSMGEVCWCVIMCDLLAGCSCFCLVLCLVVFCDCTQIGYSSRTCIQ